MSQPVDLSDNDSFAHGFVFDFFAELRARDGLYWHEATNRTSDGEGFWVASRYDDVVAVLGDASRFRVAGNAFDARDGRSVAEPEPAAEPMNTVDGARHQHLRARAERSITAEWLRAYPATARRKADELLDRILALDTVDFVSDAARELGSHILFDLLGVPDTDRARIIDWTYGFSVDESAREAYFRDLVAEKCANPGTDIPGAMIRARSQGGQGPPLAVPEVLAFVHLVYPAGADALAYAIAGAVKAFADVPEQYARLVDDPGALDSAVEEILRWTTPAMYARRIACVDAELGDRRILAGQTVTAWFASANRDERVFASPDRFDVARAPNPHLGFGFGPHACIGTGIVRPALRAFLEAAREKVARFELAGDPAWAANDRFHGLARLPVRLVGR